MSGRSHWGAGLGGSGVRETRLESGGERWHSREDRQEREEERRGVSRWMGPGWRAAAPTECRGPVASEQLQRPAFCIGWASSQWPVYGHA